ncbi:MAG TPA: DUF58 domain-containing protein [Candidatus Binataceae bacterium]|nr:DUF58 domain-containing protein [Candidatus Binataceae bacterium]
MLGLPDQFSAEFIARLEQLRIKTRREFAGLGHGAHLSPRRGSSLEFNDYRHYALGDDMRYIDWSLYGRSDKLYIKLFKEEEDLLTYIFVDASASMAYPAVDHKFQAAIATALALAYVALASGNRVMVRVMAGSGSLPAGGFVMGRHRVSELSRQLLAVRPAGALDLAPAMARELAAIRRAGKLFLVSDFQMRLDSLRQGFGLLLAANMDASAVQILGEAELEGAGLEGDVEVVDAESGERVRVAMSKRAREQHRTTLTRLAREVRVCCLRAGLRYALYSTAHGFQDFFLHAVTELGLVQ